MAQPSFPKTRVLDMLGRKDIYEVAIVAEVGSVAHGLSTEQSDHDYIVVRLESWHEFVNDIGRRDSMQIRSADEGVRSTPDDIDLSVYTLRRYTQLAINGNPSILGVLWTPNTYLERPMWSRYRDELKRYVVSKRVGQAYLGYMQQQLERWTGKSSKSVTRTELIRKHGYDTKYASHVLRLGYQGLHFLENGEIEIPMAQDTALVIRSVKGGEMPEDNALWLASDLTKQLTKAIKRSKLPDEPNLIAAQHLLATTYGNHYASHIK